jgi:hypothetical protein
MGIWDFWKSEAQDYVHGLLTAEQGPPGVVRGPIEANGCYVEVYLRRTRIVNVRSGFTRFYGAVHADVGVWHDSGKFVNFKQLIAPPDINDVAADRLERAIVSNQLLLGPTPYRGGRLQLNVVLVAVKSTDLAGPYIRLLGDLANAAGVAFVATAQPFLTTLAAGVDLLSGTPGASGREIQLVTNLVPPETGVYVVMRAPSTTIKLDDLRVQPDYLLTHRRGEDISKYPYMVMSIEASPQRTDWKGIPDIKAAYNDVQSELRRDDPPSVKAAVAAFRRTALLSEDLLATHAAELTRQVEATADDIMGAPRQAERKRKASPRFDSFNPFRSPG